MFLLQHKLNCDLHSSSKKLHHSHCEITVTAVVESSVLWKDTRLISLLLRPRTFVHCFTYIHTYSIFMSTKSCFFADFLKKSVMDRTMPTNVSPRKTFRGVSSHSRVLMMHITLVEDVCLVIFIIFNTSLPFNKMNCSSYPKTIQKYFVFTKGIPSREKLGEKFEIFHRFSRSR